MTTGRWTRAFRTPVGITAAVLMVLVLGLAILGPIIWEAQATRGRHVPDAGRASHRTTGRAPTTWAVTSWPGSLVATRLSIVLALLATAVSVSVGLVVGRRTDARGAPGRAVADRSVDIAIAFPGILLALFFAVIFGVGAIGAALAIGFAGRARVRAAVPDAHRERGRTRLHHGRADRRA